MYWNKQLAKYFTSACLTIPLWAGQPAKAVMDTRTVDGAGNNVSNPDWGAAGTQIIRINYPAFYPDSTGGSDGLGGMILEPPGVPNARLISNTLNSLPVRDGSNPFPVDPRGLSDFIWQWGQFLTHDMDLTFTGSAFNLDENNQPRSFDITVPSDDPFFAPGTIIPFNRSKFGINPNDNKREQINDVTSFIDASNVYGSDTTRADTLREMSGGRLLVDANGMMGLNTTLLPNDNNGPTPANQLFLAGDVRANEHVGLTSMHVLFTREHNRLAALIDTQDHNLPSAQTDPGARDEEIYQRARKIVGAQMQVITYNEFLPALMGDFAPEADDFNYDPQANAAITQTFAHALFRFGHSMNNANLRLVDNNGNASALSLGQAFFNPDLLKNDPTLVDQIFRGLATQKAQQNDAQIVDELRNVLFGPPIGGVGLDLLTLDIMRGRDHGLPSYTESLSAYLPQVVITSVTQITSDPDLQQALRDLYDIDENDPIKRFNINDIDLFVGALAEDPVEGMSIGLLTFSVLQDQFRRLRDGDRFFYLNDPDLYDLNSETLLSTVGELIDLENITLADIILANTGIGEIQENVFFAVPEPSTALVLAIATGGVLTRRRSRIICGPAPGSHPAAGRAITRDKTRDRPAAYNLESF